MYDIIKIQIMQKEYFYSKFQGNFNVQEEPQPISGANMPSSCSRDPGPSLSLVRCRTRHTETQRTDSSFSIVQDFTLCRFCGEGRKDTRALWIGCSHVAHSGRVKQTWENWFYVLCLGITAMNKDPLSRIGWQCPHHMLKQEKKYKVNE